MEYIYLDRSIEALVNQFENSNLCSLDIETTGLNPLDSRILLIQVGFPGGIDYVVNSKVDITPILKYLESPKVETIIHRAGFEQKFIQYNYKTVIRGVYDSQLAEVLISSDPKAPSSLAYCSKKYLDIDMDKTVRESFINMTQESFTPEQLEYAALDVDVLFGIREAQKIQLKELGLETVAAIEFDLAAVVANMELVGVPVDVSKWRRELLAVAQDHAESSAKIIETLFPKGEPEIEQIGLFGDNVELDKKGKKVKEPNINSPKQIAEALGKLGIKLPKTPKGNFSTNERVLENIKHPATQELVKYRGLQKIMSSYDKSFLDKIHPFTGRIHAEWHQIGTETGRFSCENPNLQQIPDRFRQCVRDPNLKIVVADYSQIELRIIAEMSGDENMIAAFNSEHDLHTATAATMFGKSAEEVTKNERFTAKIINFGVAYGMGVPKLQDTLNASREKKDMLTRTKVQELWQLHQEAFATASTFLKRQGYLAYAQGYSTTMLGRRRYFRMPNPENPIYDKLILALKREGSNAPIQGTNADITKLAMVNLFDDFISYRYRADIIIAVHDEIVVLAHKADAEAVKILVEESMIRSAQEVLKRVPVTVEAFVVDYWKKGD